jgi:hypothetical protein
MRTVGLTYPAKKVKAPEAKEPKTAKVKDAKAEAEVVQPDTDEAEMKEE